MAARIEGISDARAGIMVRLAYWFSKRMVGKVAEPLRVTAHHPGILRAYGSFEFWLGRASSAPPKLKALAQLKVAALVGCPF
jgi:hypothetical protein